jgi:hypothetical protein
MLNRCSSFLYYNLRFSQVLHHQGNWVLHHFLRCYHLLHRSSEVLLCRVTTPSRKSNIKSQTLAQLTTWRFLNARSEISIWYLDMSVVFMVIGYWELIFYLDWENKISNAGNSFVRLGSNFKPVNVAAGVYWCWTSSRPVSYVVICLLSYGSDYWLNRSAYGFVLVVRRWSFKGKLRKKLVTVDFCKSY